MDGKVTSPADDVVRGLERVIANTFLKLNRTVEYKIKDDADFERRVSDARRVVSEHESKVKEAEECIANAESDEKQAKIDHDKLVDEKNNLNASIANLKKAMEVRGSAGKDLIAKVSEWKDAIVDESGERLNELKASSDALLSAIREKKGGKNNMNPLESIRRPSSAPPVIQAVDPRVATPVVGISLSSGAGQPVTQRPSTRDATVSSLLETGEDGDTQAEEQTSFDTLTENIGEFMKLLSDDVEGTAPSLKEKLEAVAQQAPATEDLGKTVHKATLDELYTIRGSIDGAIQEQTDLATKARDEANKCQDENRALGPLLEEAQKSLKETKEKRKASDAYYAKHVLHFKQTIEFAQETLKSVERRASEEFSGQGWDEQLKKMREDIARTLALCAKLEGKNASTGTASPPKLVNMQHVAVRSTNSKTDVQVSAKTRTKEVIAEQTTVGGE